MERAREKALVNGARAFVVTHLPNVRYLCGFTGSAGALVIERDRATLFADGRYTVQARGEAPGVRLVITRGPLLEALGHAVRRHGKARVAFEPAALNVQQHEQLRHAAGPRIRWVMRAGVVEDLRAVKDEGELAQMKRAADLGCVVFEQVLAFIRPGVRELDLAAEIEYRMKKEGASGPAFETIVAFGERAALPHAQPTRRKLGKNELVVLDLGAILSGYCCDLTRTVHLGRARQNIRRWYRAVQGAQQAAIEVLAAGVAAGKVDAAARRVLRKAGLSRYFVHSTGHGLGIEVHEVPRLAKGQTQILQAGNVVTIEPGVYIPGTGGIRIEDDVAVLQDRVEVLTRAPREFLEL